MQIEAGGGGQSKMQIEVGRSEMQSEMRQLGLEKDEWGRIRGCSRTDRDIWLSVTYAWRIMRNMRHAYLTLSQIPRGSNFDNNTSLPQW
jgi:hypothetical protein